MYFAQETKNRLEFSRRQSREVYIKHTDRAARARSQEQQRPNRSPGIRAAAAAPLTGCLLGTATRP